MQTKSFRIRRTAYPWTLPTLKLPARADATLDMPYLAHSLHDDRCSADLCRILK
jgi:hypothetical protein